MKVWRSTHKAVHTQGGAHTRQCTHKVVCGYHRSLVILLFKGGAGGWPKVERREPKGWGGGGGYGGDYRGGGYRGPASCRLSYSTDIGQGHICSRERLLRISSMQERSIKHTWQQ